MARYEDVEAHVRAIFAAAVRAADPARCVSRSLGMHPAAAGGAAVLAVGKAAAGMWEGLGEELRGSGRACMVVPDGTAAPAWALRADHPVPSRRSVQAGEAVVEFVRSAADGGWRGLVVLLSGGASSLLCLPRAGVDIEEYGELTRRLLGDGRVAIEDLNAVRAHVETIKGGGLGAHVAQERCVVLVLSDVVGDDVRVIGSGPFAAGEPACARALAAADRHARDLPTIRAVLDACRRGACPARTDQRRRAARIEHVIVGNNALSVHAAAREARGLGLEVAQARTGVRGIAREVGGGLGRRLRALEPGSCAILGGETTVDLGVGAGGESPRGGRNLELALAGAIAIDGLEGAGVASLATDGVDGSSDAAGALATGETCARARGLGLDPGLGLARHESHGFFERAGGLIRTGATGTNVGDVALAVRYGG